MISKLKPKQLLMLGSVIFLVFLFFHDKSQASILETTEPVLIEFRDDGFSEQNLTALVGTTVTWRNSTDTPLHLRGIAFQNNIYLPVIRTTDRGAIATPTSKLEMDSIESSSSPHGFETIVAPGGEFSYQINTTGRFDFFDFTSPDWKGQIIIVPLTRIYRGDDGSALYLRSVGNKIYGFGEHPGQQYAYALSGTMGDSHISATFWDVPKASRMESGEVLIHVSNGGAQLVLESGSEAIGTDAWQEIAPGSFSWPPMQPAGFQEITTDNLTGAFVGDDHSRHYIRQIDDETVVWVAEAPAQPDERPAWVSVFVGDILQLGMVQASGFFADVPKGLTNAYGPFDVLTLQNRILDLEGPGWNRTDELEPDYVVDWDIFESGIRSALDNKVIGYAYAIGKGSALQRSGAYGYRLLSQDGGPELFTDETIAQAFSTSKTMTAVALVRALHNRSLSVDSLVEPFLPDCWEQGEGIGTLKFRELLDHTSGLTEPTSGDPYLVLKKLIADGRTGVQGYNYNNAAYALMRYLIPLIAHENEAKALFTDFDCQNDGTEINDALSTMFGDYLFGMLELVDVNATFFKDQDPDPTLMDLAYLYNRNYHQFQGLGPNLMGWNRSGAGYVATSVKDYRRFLGALDQGQILPEWLVESMYEGDLGFDGKFTGDAGQYYQKDGAATSACGDAGQAQLMIYPSGIHAYIMTNSATDGNPIDWYYDFNHNLGAPDEVIANWGASSDIPFAGDFDLDGYVDDVGVYRPSNQTWYYDYDHNGGTPDEVIAGWGASSDIPFAGDFDHDGYVDDVGTYRPSNQTWYYDYDHNGGTTNEEVSGWGLSGDLPLTGDFDGDGYVDDVGVFRPSNQTWYYDYNHNGAVLTDAKISGWGISGDLPFAGDFDRDGYVDDVGMFRPSNQTWYYDYNHNGTTDVEVPNWGLSVDLPFAGDFDRDGYVDDVGVYRHSEQTWYYDYNHDGGVPDEEVSGFGGACDVPVAGDFDRDGYLDDVAAFRPSNGGWYYDHDHDGAPSDESMTGWGKGSDMPLAGDFDGDGQVDDVGLFRNRGLDLGIVLRDAFDNALELALVP